MLFFQEHKHSSFIVYRQVSHRTEPCPRPVHQDGHQTEPCPRPVHQDGHQTEPCPRPDYRADIKSCIWQCLVSKCIFSPLLILSSSLLIYYILPRLQVFGFLFLALPKSSESFCFSRYLLSLSPSIPPSFTPCTPVLLQEAPNGTSLP